MNILVFNAGSSSLKFALFQNEMEALSGLVDWSGGGATLRWNRSGHAESQKALQAKARSTAVGEIKTVLREAGLGSISLEAIGQRVVHGGTTLRQSVRITAEVKAEIERLTELAPLHNPPALEAIAEAESAFPGVPQYAVFDTAYFQSLPAHEYIYPVPYAWYQEWGIRRFGFHGISHAYCAKRAAEILQRKDLRVISCHLGQGCSATASRAGQAVATTMGFTPLEGLMMGSRSGSIDPGLVLYVQRQRGLSAEKLEKILNHESGVAGISGLSNDFREVGPAAASGQERARLAMDMFSTRVRAAVGSLAVTMGGVDALVFTAGVGEHDADIRAEICRGLDCLGVGLDPTKNTQTHPDGDIAHPSSRVRILLIHAQEEKSIAAEIMSLI